MGPVPYASVFDTNTYRSIPALRFAEVSAAESRAETIPYIDPWVAMELVAHLRDPEERQHRPARAAIRRIVEHSKSVRGRTLRSAMLIDSESQVALHLFGKRLPTHDQALAALTIACEYVASVGMDSPLDEIAPIVDEVAAHVSSVESTYAKRVFDLLIRPVIPDATAWDAVSREPSIRNKALAFMRSEEALVALALSESHRAYDEAGHPRPASVLTAVAESVLSTFRYAFELQREVLCGVLGRGWSLERAGRSNWVWDVQIAFNVGRSVDLLPIRLITDDQQFHDVALRTGYKALVLKLDDYAKTLLTS